MAVLTVGASPRLGANTEPRAASPAYTAAAVLIVDQVGEVFEVVHRLGLGLSLWRILEVRRLPPANMDLVIVAVYGRVDWSILDALGDRAPTLIMTTAFDRDDATAAMNRGLVGYVDLSMPQEPMTRTINGVLKGEPAYGRDITGAWLRARRELTPRPEARIDLTKRQREIVALIARGATDKEIGAALGIATATAQKHVTNILERLNVPNRAAAVATVVTGGAR